MFSAVAHAALASSKMFTRELFLSSMSLATPSPIHFGLLPTVRGHFVLPMGLSQSTEIPMLRKSQTVHSMCPNPLWQRLLRIFDRTDCLRRQADRSFRKQPRLFSVENMPFADRTKVTSSQWEYHCCSGIELEIVHGSLFAESATFHALIISKTQATQSSSFDRPLGLIAYVDEITPGNVLAARVSRKCWRVYAPLLDFCLETLGQELAWAPLLHIRSTLSRVSRAVSLRFLPP